jgi:excisionase family DNA binding protein
LEILFENTPKMKLINIKNASRLYNIKESCLYKWAREGRIPHYRVGHLVRFNVEEVDEWLRRHKKAPEATEKPRRMSFEAPGSGSIDPHDIAKKAIDEVLGSSYNSHQRGNQTVKPGKEG